METTTTPGNSVVSLEEHIKYRSLWGDAARRFSNNRLAMFGLIIVVSLVLVAIFADVLAPYDYAEADSHD